MNTFNLCDDPWIQVRDLQGRTRDVSIRRAFDQADSIAAIGGEVPTQAAAILRLLLAILYRALPGARDLTSALGLWARWWNDGLPLPVIHDYLDKWQHRFDLRDPEQPFMQVAGLATASGKRSGLTKIIADLPDGHAFFTQRAGSGRTRLSAAEAARWVVHCQAFDPSGIKTGAIGDDRVKGGRGYPIGVAWTGNLGVIIIEGATLQETLLLNFDRSRPLRAEDEPVWERPAQGPAVEEHHATPRGPADLLTWQSRRILLVWHGDEVVDVQISNGDPLGAQNRQTVESMTAWRRSANQEKKLGLATVYMPQVHDPARQVWRGLAGLLDPKPVASREAATRERSSSLEWLAKLSGEGLLPAAQEVRLRTVGVAYGSNNSVIDAVIDDALDGRVAAVADPRVIALALQAVSEADQGVRSLADLAGNLADATNSDRDAARSRAREQGYAALDPLFRVWFAALASDTSTEAALTSWAQAVSDRLTQEGLMLAESAGPGAIRGRNTAKPNEKSRHMDAGKAWMFFRMNLRERLSLADAPTPEGGNRA